MLHFTSQLFISDALNFGSWPGRGQQNLQARSVTRQLTKSTSAEFPPTKQHHNFFLRVINTNEFVFPIHLVGVSLGEERD